MTTSASKLPRELRMIYREIPATSSCKSGCSDCCGPVPWSPAEVSRIITDIPLGSEWIEVAGVRALMNPATGKCSFASTDGCKVYDRRPFMCRLFATSIESTRLRCPHGVRPAHPLSAHKAAALTNKYIQASK